MSHKFRNCSCEIPQLKGKSTIEIGDTFEFDFFLISYDEPLDLTGSTLTLTLVDDTYEPSITLVKTVGDGLIVLSATDGHGKGILEPADTEILGPDGGPLFYELVIVDVDNNVFTALEGTILLTR